jgi:hypothetical protein
VADNSRYVTFYGEIADGDSASPGKLLALRVSMRSGEIAPLELEEREAPTVRSPGVAPRSPRPSTPRVMAPRSDRVVRTLRNLFGLVVEAIGKEGPHG